MRKISTTILKSEVDGFSKLAGDWWNAEGAFKSLHRLNPLRISYIREKVCSHFRRDVKKEKPLKGLTILDVGCGGGLLAEAMAGMGATVVGIDASPEAVKTAKAHAKKSKLAISYAVADAEELAATGKRFDIITAFEIVEHVTDAAFFVSSLSKLLKKDGLLLMATMNRTTKSFIFGVVMAEYVLGWVPKGAHDWDSFIKPSELTHILKDCGLSVSDLTGVVFDPLEGKFVMHPHKLDVNYMLAAIN